VRKTFFAVLVLTVTLMCGYFLTRDVVSQATRVLARNQIDFLAFYCAGKVSAVRADSYRAEPLRSCEEAAMGSLGHKYAMARYLVVPAPLPPYALAPFSLFGFMTYRVAATVWFALLLAACALSIVLLRRLTGLSVLALFFPVLLADGLASIIIGQIVPIVLCFVCASALALREDKPFEAAGYAVATLLEAHIGLALCLALFVLEPRSRRGLLVFGGLLAALSLAYGGLGQNVEYLARVVPAQAHAEGLSFSGQYSLSALLAQLGVAPGPALQLGSLSYLLMLVISIGLAGRLARTLHDKAYVVLVPPALVLLGGAYAHIHQMALALPLAFMLVARRSPWRPLALTALLLLAIPWQSFAEMPFFYSKLPPLPHFDVRPAMSQIADGGRLAEDEWGLWQSLPIRDRRTSLQRFETKLPTWLGLIALTVVTFGLASGGIQSESLEARSRANFRSITRA
jgi:hypothetical protein